MGEEKNNHVVVIDIKMRFWSMVIFMVKAAIASIPALIILTAISALVFGSLQALIEANPLIHST